MAKARSFLTLSLASSNLPAPRACPIIIDMAVAQALKTIKKKVVTVFEIVKAFSTSVPRSE